MQRWLRAYGRILAVGAALIFLAQGVEARPVVEGVSFVERADGQGYVVRVSTSAPVSAYTTPRRSGNRLKWMIFNADLARSYRRAAATGPVQAYTVEPRGAHLLLTFTLRPSAEVEAAAYRDRASSDLLLGLTYPGGPPVAQASTPPVATSGSKGGAMPKAGARWRLDTIVIDAGHGGKDPGAQAYGLNEKDLVLDIALKLGGLIDARMPGVNVVYTRKTDVFVTLHDRGHIANRAGGKLFISIHANAARGASAHGTETYFLGLHKTEAARKVMERENSVIFLEENPEQYADLTKGALQTLAQSAFLGQSEHLAALVQEQFTERLGRTNRGVKQAGFLVLWAASMPAILVETGFITNREEAHYLASEEGQTEIARAIFRAVRAFKKDYQRGLPAIGK